jgi:hypothetical protein
MSSSSHSSTSHPIYYSCAISFHFLDILVDVLADLEAIPEDNGILEDEWEDDDYPEIESIKLGTSGKEWLIVLPRDEWFPRAVQWAQALDLLKRCLLSWRRLRVWMMDTRMRVLSMNS